MPNRTLINAEKYHNAPQAMVERILAKRQVSAEGCWLWPRSQTTHDGYGHAAYRHRGKRPKVYVHRLVYMRLVADPGDHMELDHLCHDPAVCRETGRDCPHRRCFNPAHLTPATPEENLMRSSFPRGLITHCPAGHEYTPTNTYLNPTTGSRDCRQCHRLEMAAWRAAESCEDRRARLDAMTSARHVIRLAEARFCSICGVSISHRSRRSIYCEPCSADQSAPMVRLKKKLRAATHRKQL